MTYEMKMREERKIGREEGRESMLSEIVLSMLKNNQTIDFIAQNTNVSVDTIKKIASANGVML